MLETETLLFESNFKKKLGEQCERGRDSPNKHPLKFVRPCQVQMECSFFCGRSKRSNEVLQEFPPKNK